MSEGSGLYLRVLVLTCFPVVLFMKPTKVEAAAYLGLLH